MNGPAPDPVLERRQRYARWVRAGLRGGWACFGLAVLAFAVALFSDFPGWLATTIIVLMAVGSVLLAPALVFSYAIKAAEREDRELGL